MKKLIIPRFRSENLEAEWFHKNRARLEADMRRRLRAGGARSLADAWKTSAATEKAKLRPVTIRMRSGDLATARQWAERAGLPYQTYMKMLLREGLRRELGRLASARLK